MRQIKTILEFNEQHQQFHWNSVLQGVPISKENTNGYKTLMYCVDDNEANIFTSFLFALYMERDKKLSFNEAEIVIKNLQSFLIASQNK